MTKKDQRPGDSHADETETTTTTGEEEAIPMPAPAGKRLPEEPAQNPQAPTMR